MVALRDHPGRPENALGTSGSVWGVLEVIREEIVPLRGCRTQLQPIVATVPVAKVHPTACLCVQCGHVSEAVNDCPLCGSVAMLNISRLLDREGR